MGGMRPPRGMEGFPMGMMGPRPPMGMRPMMHPMMHPMMMQVSPLGQLGTSLP